jgi:hypothetical protein
MQEQVTELQQSSSQYGFPVFIGWSHALYWLGAYHSGKLTAAKAQSRMLTGVTITTKNNSQSRWRRSDSSTQAFRDCKLAVRS